MIYTSRVAAALVATIALASIAQEDEVIVQALKDEMDRSLNELQLEDSPKPYFVGYTVFDNTQVDESFFVGTSVRNGKSRNRRLQVDVRVGSYDLDNRNYRPRMNRPSTIMQALPITEDYEELRRAIWRATDVAYKNAVQNYAAKLTALENRRIGEPIADFTQEDPFRLVEESASDVSESALATIRAPAQALSELFIGETEIYTSVVAATAAERRRIYINSEGSFHDIREQLCRIRTLAFTQAADGTELQDYSTETSLDCNSLASLDDMKTRVQEMIARLRNAREAEPPEEVYNGPVLFEGQAGAEIVRSLLLSRLLAVRNPMTDDPRADSMRFRNPFLDKIGARVISARVDVVNDPVLSTFNDRPLLGHYAVDRQGVPASTTMLIEDGRLKTLLTTRSPVDDFDKSTGSSRRGGSAIPGNILVLPKEGEGLSDEEMREEMNLLIQDYALDYGIVVRRLANRSEQAFGNRTSVVLEAYKVFPDGREELIPSVEITGYSDRTLRDVIAVSEELVHYDTVYGGGGGTWVTPMSIVSPSILIEELTVRKMRPISPKPPVIPHPIATEAPSID